MPRAPTKARHLQTTKRVALDKLNAGSPEVTLDYSSNRDAAHRGVRRGLPLIMFSG